VMVTRLQAAHQQMLSIYSLHHPHEPFIEPRFTHTQQHQV
jgi:hypothetical protein